MTDIRVGIIDSNELVRAGRAMIIGAQPNMKVVLEESIPQVALLKAPEYLVDILLVGENQHGFARAEFIKQLNDELKAAENSCRIISLAAFENDAMRYNNLASGATEVVSLEAEAETFIGVLNSVQAVDYLSNVDSMRKLVRVFGRLVASRELQQTIDKLDDVQNRILNSFLAGKSDAETATLTEVQEFRVQLEINSLMSAGNLLTRNQLALTLLDFK